MAITAMGVASRGGKRMRSNAVLNSGNGQGAMVFCCGMDATVWQAPTIDRRTRAYETMA